MKKPALVIFFLFVYSVFSLGQLIPSKTGFPTKTIIVNITMPLVIIDSMETDDNSLIIHPDNYKIKVMYRDSLELIPFGEKGKGGVVIAETVNNTRLWRLPAVLNYFKISAQNRKLKVLVDHVLIHPHLFLADINKIERIEVEKQDLLAPYRYSFNTKEKFLNIVTRKEH